MVQEPTEQRIATLPVIEVPTAGARPLEGTVDRPKLIAGHRKHFSRLADYRVGVGSGVELVEQLHQRSGQHRIRAVRRAQADHTCVFTLHGAMNASSVVGGILTIACTALLWRV